MNYQEFIEALESGALRAAAPDASGTWQVNSAVKEGILDLFRRGQLTELHGMYTGFTEKHTLTTREFYVRDQVRMVPGGSAVRIGTHVGLKVIIMPPSYINIGAYVDEGTMVDSHVLVGSCAQVGKNVHLSAGVQIGGVLEPIGARPVIIEDNVFVGAGSVIVEGIHVKEGAVIAPGVVLSKSIPIYDCLQNQLVTDGVIPENTVVVAGARPATQAYAKQQGLYMNCALIIKKRDAGSDAALTLESALREETHG